MADENIVRSYRSAGPVRRPSESAPARDVGARNVGARDGGPRDTAPRSDPLAELARLIGQSDPFADPPPVSPRSRMSASPPPPRAEPAPVSDWRATAAALARESLRSPPVADPPFEEHDPQVERINSAIADIDSYRTESDPRYAEPEHSRFAEEHAAAPYDEHAYFGAGGEEQYAGSEERYASSEEQYAEPEPVQPQAHEEPNYFFDGE